MNEEQKKIFDILYEKYQFEDEKRMLVTHYTEDGDKEYWSEIVYYLEHQMSNRMKKLVTVSVLNKKLANFLLDLVNKKIDELDKEYEEIRENIVNSESEKK